MLRFYGVPILASPVLSFPLSEERKSGFLPPSFGIDNRSGFQAAIPYYWNIAPNRDATFTMQESLRRGPSLDGEFRYLEPSLFGLVNAKVLPNDRVADRSRYSFRAEHDGALPYDAFVQLRVLRVSDDDYWKDFPGEIKSLTPRLLQTDLLVARPFGDWSTYARAMRWQVLQTEDPTTRIDLAVRARAADRHALRRARGEAASTSASRPSSIASPTRTTAFSSSARPVFARTRSAASPGRSSRPAGR